jgi:hypothetical protein
MNEPELYIEPERFFSFEIECKKVLTPLSNIGEELFGRESFAKFFMSWSEEGLSLKVQVALTKEVEVAYPQITSKDVIELFIDTRDVKQARTTHRYCHHFFFLPESFEGISRGEITKFRTEDTHELCRPDDLELKIVHEPLEYLADIFIPKSALCGYDPQEGANLGFSYRVHRSDGTVQLFGFGNDEIAIERYPYLWSRVCLI